RERPDVMVLNELLYASLAETGQLRELDSLIHRDQFDIENLHAPIVDLLTSLGSGSLLGLSPMFVSEALFYNRTLFENVGVELPTDRMSWDEVIHTAMRFVNDGSAEERIYGYFENVT